MLTEFAVVASLKVVGAILEFVLQVIVARALGPGLYGQLAFLLGLGESLFYLLFGGMPKLTVRYASLGYDLSETWKEYLLKVGIPAIAFTCLGLTLVGKSGLITVGPLIAFALLCFTTANSTLYGYGYSVLAAFFEYVVLRSVAFSLVLVAIRATPEYILFSMLLAQLGAYVVVIGLQQLVVSQLTRDRVGPRPRGVVKELLSFQGIELAVHGTGILPRVLGYIFGGAVVNAYLAIAFQVRNAVTLLSGPTTKVFLRRFVQSESEVIARRKVYQSVARLQAYSSVPAFLFVICHTDLVARAFGASFEGVERVIQPIAVLAMLEVLLGPASNYLQMTNRQSLELKNQLASLGLLVVGSFVGWMAGSGPQAVVIGLVVSTVAVGLIRLVQLWVMDNIVPHPKGQILYVLTWSGMAFSVTTLVRELSGTWGTIASVLVLIALALAMLVFSPEAEDRQFVHSAIRGVYRAVSQRVRTRHW